MRDDRDMPRSSLPVFSKGSPVTAIFHTDLGDITVKLHTDDCPVTCGNFVGLATGKMPWTNPQGETVTTPLYDNTIFHRVIKDFMLQGGDPMGTGMGGPGYRFEDECKPHLKHNKPGILSMANAGPGTNGSQFFLTEIATPWLDGKHTVFGEVIQGMDVLLAIANTKTGAGDRPVKPIHIKTISIQGA